MNHTLELSSSWRDNFMLYIPSGPFLKIKTEEDMKPSVIILCGIPTSGKTKWIKKFKKSQPLPEDDFRTPYFLSDSTPRFNSTLNQLVKFKRSIVLNDDDVCIESNLRNTIGYFVSKGYSIKIKFFDVPLWRSYLIYIVNKVTGNSSSLKDFYNKIDKKQFENYIL